MTDFVGRADDLLLFTDAGQGVIVDAAYSLVVASGEASVLRDSKSWGDGEFTDRDEEVAVAHLSTVTPVATGRLYTIPKSVQVAANRALEWTEDYGRGETRVGLHAATTLASGGQVPFETVQNLYRYFATHDYPTVSATEQGEPNDDRISWGLYGGTSAQKWTESVIDTATQQTIRASAEAPPVNPFLEAHELDETVGPEFLARVRTDGSGIDRLYKVDLDRSVYVWGDGFWDNLGDAEGDIWIYDSALDPITDRVEKTHVVIDPDSAVILAARFTNEPDKPVLIEDIDPEESALAVDSIGSEDWEFVNRTLTAAAVASETDGIYTEEERSENAGSQIRDSNGRFAEVGGTVVVNGNPVDTGKITAINAEAKTVTVELPNGSVEVPAAQTEVIDPATAQVPGQLIPEDNNPLDTTGILAEPRTPINYVGAQLPGTLPAISREDLHNLLGNWAGWVSAQRDSFSPTKIGNLPKGTGRSNSDDIGDSGREQEAKADKMLTKDANVHPLISEWMKRKNSATGNKNSMWYDPIIAAGAPQAGGTEITPETSDVAPLYMAIVAPEDPRAVLEVVSLVPVSTVSPAPMTFTREERAWMKDPQVLMDLNSPTPPPVVPLDVDTLDDVLNQVDNGSDEAPEEAAPAAAPADPAAAPAPVDAQTAPVVASAIPAADVALMVLYGPSEALIAAGGADRNRGGAEQLRRYWTWGAGAAKIRWGSGGDWTRCVRYLSKYLGTRAKGYCALRHKEMTGQWTGDKRHRQMYSASGGERIFSDELVATIESVEATAFLNAKSQDLYNRVHGLTAAAGSVNDIQLGARFTIPLVIPEEAETGDGRMFKQNAITLREMPLPLMWQIKTSEGHDLSAVVGRIDFMERIADGIGNAYGYFDTGVYGREAERMVRHGMLRGVSADMDQFEAQVEEVETFAEKDDIEPVKKDKIIVSKARVMGVTIVAKPAFQECKIFLDEEDENLLEEIVLPDGIYVEEEDPIAAAALTAAAMVASAIPVAPPKEWFQDPGFRAAAPITVTDDGQVFGHIAAWDVDHIGMAYGTKPPRSRSNYAYFNTGVVHTQEGTKVSVGQLTLAGGHASLQANAAAAVKHYDDTASAIADVHAGEDAYGIWVAGALRPEATPEQIRTLRASAPSGDWRPIRGRLELVAVCQVNVPGFPVARARVASGQIYALVAAGAREIAKLQSDPLSELTQRLEMMEQFTKSELSTRSDAARARVEAARAARNAPLIAKAETLSAKFNAVKAERNATLTASANALRARVAAGSKKVEPDPKVVAPEPAEGVGDGGLRVVYNPDNQPRDSRGKFRLVLARLRDNLGDDAPDDVLKNLKRTENLDQIGDVDEAAKSAVDLISSIDRMETGKIQTNVSAMREATRDIGKVVANLPLPFDDQSEKVRFSDLPPALRQLTEDLLKRVEKKLSNDDSRKATAKLKAFMSGSDVFSQGEISEQLNLMLRLLT